MFTIDTASVADKERLEYWRDVVCDQFVPLTVEPRDHRHFSGHLQASAVGALQLRDLTATPHLFDRTPRLLRRSDEDYFKIGLMETGTSLFVQDGREAALGPGDLVLYDSSRPYSVLMDGPFRIRVYMLPKRLLPVRAHELRNATAITMSGQHGVGALTVPFLRHLSEHAEEYTDAAGEALTHAFAGLLTALVRDQDAVARDLPGVANPHLCRIYAYIDEHIAERDLSPARVAAATAISVSYLHKLFSMTGTTVGGYVRERRLQGCWRDLREDRMGHLSITAIGARWGIPDPAHLSRLFHARFGVTPTQCRGSRPTSQSSS